MKKKNLLTASAVFAQTTTSEVLSGEKSGKSEKGNMTTGFDSSGQQSEMQQRK